MKDGWSNVTFTKEIRRALILKDNILETEKIVFHSPIVDIGAVVVVVVIVVVVVVIVVVVEVVVVVVEW